LIIHEGNRNLEHVPTVQYTQLFNAHNDLNIKLSEFQTLIENLDKCRELFQLNTTATVSLIEWVPTAGHNTISREHETVSILILVKSQRKIRN
jgi:hypothetical protein